MAKGLTASLERIATVIEGCDSNTSWKRTKQRITSITGEQVTAAGLDQKYWITAKKRKERPVVAAADLVTANCDVIVELARYWGGGDKKSKDYYALQKTLEAQADTVEQNIGFPNNWDVDNTGIILMNLDEADLVEHENLPLLLWIAKFSVMIRYSQDTTTV